MGSRTATPQSAAGSQLPVDAPQYMRALEQANHVRLARSALKRRLAAQPTKQASCTMCAEVLEDPPEVLANMTVAELLMACRRIGMIETRKILMSARMSELKRLNALTSMQRASLISALNMAGWGR